MNIEEFVNNYLQEHRHDVLLNPYNGLIDENGDVKKYNSMTEAAKDNGVSISAIKRVLIGTNKSGKCNGCTFRYSKELSKEDEK